jgi:hypothetical protein
MTELENKILFYGLLKNKPIGYREELETDFRSIGGQNFEQIYGSSMRIGLLQAGVDGTFKKRYKVTEFGKRQIVAFIELNDYLNE